jgi:hypothetical protein
MSKQDFLDALNLKMPARVPRTEFAADGHWELVKQVTGIDTSIVENRRRASCEFVKKWNYGICWGTDVGPSWMQENGGRTTFMGTATHTAAGGEYNPHAVCPFKNVEEALSLDPYREYAQFGEERLIKHFNDRYDMKQQLWPDTVILNGIYISLFSGLIEIFGWDMMLSAMGEDIDRFNQVVDGYQRWVKQFFDALAKCKGQTILIHDDLCWTSGPVNHVSWYRENIFRHYKKLWQPIKDAGKKIIFTSDGTIDMLFDDIVDCGPDMVVMEPTANMQLFAQKYGDRCGFVGGVDTRVLLSGSRADIYQAVKKAMDIGKPCPGFVLAVGNHIPENTPVESALYYNEVYEQMAQR